MRDPALIDDEQREDALATFQSRETTPDELVEDSYYQRIILNGIQVKVEKGQPIYRGTVTPEEKAKRRAKAKRARAARRNNR